MENDGGVRRCLRGVGHALVRGGVLIGAAWSCGGELPAILAELDERRVDEADQVGSRPVTPRDIEREVAEGMAALERYLAR